MSESYAPTRHLVQLTTMTILLFSFTGCAEPKGVIFEPSETPLRWPAAPATPRIEYVGQIATDADLKPGRSIGEALDETLFGAKSTRSMLSPYAVCSDDAERIFVCDSNAQVVHVFELDTREYHQWRPAEDEPFAQPVGLAWDPDRRLLVSDAVAGCIYVFDDDGRWIGSLGAEHLERPCGIAFDERRGWIFVADSAAHSIVVLDRQGNLIRRLGERGVGPRQFNFPTNVALDEQGRLVVSDSLNFRVQLFDTELAFVRVIGRPGDQPGCLSQPKGVSLDSESHLYVVDAHFESVQIFDLEGHLLLAFGREGRDPGEFWLPAGIHIDSKDRIWIADTYNRRVQVFQYLGGPE